MEQRVEMSPRKAAVTMTGLSLGLLMSALDTTIVSTAMPSVARELAGMGLYAWPFTAYLICSTVATLVFGKLSDAWGRKKVFIGGLLWFMAASGLCGAATSMKALIACRGLQGIGGGVITSTAFAIVGEAFPPRERGKYMGLLGAMFGLASVLGPTVGGLVADNLGWRWIFYMNLPLGAASLAVLAIGLAGHAEERERQRFDWVGIILFALSIVPLLLALSLGGKSYPWLSAETLGLFGLALASGAAFIAVERRVGPSRAILPFAFFKDREYAASTLGSFFSNAVFFAGILLIPLYLQRVMRSTATGSGLSTTPLVLAYAAAAAIAGQLISKSGRYRGLAIGSSVLAAAALVPLGLLKPEWGELPLLASMLLLGIGLGATTPIFMIAAQSGVATRDVGAATASIMFFRNLGSSVASAIYGAVMTGSLSGMLGRFDWGGTPDRVRTALGDSQILMNSAAVDAIVAAVPAERRDAMNALVARLDTGLAGALSSAFWAALAFAAAALAACLAFGKGGQIRETNIADIAPRP
jgi:EmrB/QacA subfamily drug resistance transporter